MECSNAIRPSQIASAHEPALPVTDRWFAYRKVRPYVRMRLFCFPYAGGSAKTYREWADALPSKVEVCPVELPGRGTRITDPPFARLVDLVEVIAQKLSPYLDLPYAFFGHSMGGLLAFELARKLRQQCGTEPSQLFVSACAAPPCMLSHKAIHGLPIHEFINELRRLNGTPKVVLQHQELIDLLLPMLRADFAMIETYQYVHDAPLGCPISVLGGTRDAEVSHAELEAWREQTHAAFSLSVVPGDHFFVDSLRSMVIGHVHSGLSPLLGTRLRY